MRARMTVAAGLLVFAIGCGKSSTPTSPTTSTSSAANPNPSPPAAQCAISVSPSTQAAPIVGGTFSAAVTTPDGCAWTASRQASWLNITSGATGRSNGTITYTVQSNTADAGRTGAILVRGDAASASVAVTQDGVTQCTYTLSPSAASVSARGGAFSFRVTRNTPNGCSWSAQTSTPWISLTGATSGLSPGTIAYTVAANTTGARRTGAIIILWHGGSADLVVDQSR